MVDLGGGVDGALGPDSGDHTRARTIELIVSTDLASTVLLRAATIAQIIAAAGAAVWVALTYLQWHQFRDQQGLSASASTQAIGALEPFSTLILAAVLGMVGVGCRMAGNWIRLKLATEYLNEHDADSPLE